MFELTLIDWFLIFLIVSFVVSFFLHKLKIGQRYFYLITMVRSKKPIKYFDLLASHKKFWNWFADIGLVIGLGAFGVDYLFGRKQKKIKRIMLFALSAFILTAFSYFLFAPMLNSPIALYDYSLLFSIFFGISGLGGFALIALVVSALEIILRTLQGIPSCPAVAPLIPGVELPNVPITVPLHGWISLLIILIIHEGSHGVLARKAKIAVKSTGILLFGFLPIGAFVEPNDKSLLKAKKIEQLRVFSSGASANFYVFVGTILISLLLLFAVLNPFIVPQFNEFNKQGTKYLFIKDIKENTEFCHQKIPNAAYGELEPGWIIRQANNKKIETLQDYFIATQATNIVELQLENKQGNLINKTLEKNKFGLIGFTVEVQKNEDFEMPFEWFILGLIISFGTDFIRWFILLNLMIATVNFLPTEPFDGGKIAKIIFSDYLKFTGLNVKKRKKLISRFFGLLILGLLLLNALPLFFTPGL